MRESIQKPAIPLIISILLFLTSNSLLSQEVKQIDINADFIEYDSNLGSNANRLIGKVRFSHEGILMTCDSAHYFSDVNVVDAFSNVHLWQGDTLDLYGDYLKYNGNEGMARVRNNVILIDNENRLTTDYLDHNFNTDFAYYLGGGKILNGDNTLVSEKGYYYTREKTFFFKDSVIITNPDYVMYSDTLKYNTLTEIAYFLGPTEITSEENYIFCENGWYDTQKNISQFSRNAFLQSKEQILKGDSIYYERETGIGKAYKNVELIDTTQNILLTGNVAFYNEQTEYGMLTDSAVMIQIEGVDSLFVHSDTIMAVPDTIPEKRIIKSFYKVKFYRADLQGKCDSLSYTETDSTFRMFGDPVLWTDNNQLTAEFIDLITINKELERIEMKNRAFIIGIEDSLHFNQIKGRDMTGYILENQLQRIDVNGNSETIYYARDEEELIGVNKALSSDLVIRFLDNEIHKIIYLTNPAGKYHPLSKFPDQESRLEDFIWLDRHRPGNKMDIFIWKE